MFDWESKLLYTCVNKSTVVYKVDEIENRWECSEKLMKHLGDLRIGLDSMLPAEKEEIMMDDGTKIG